MRQECPDQRHCRFTVIAVLLASCALVLCAVQGIFGYPFRKTIALDPAKFIPVEGFAYSAPLLAHYSPWGAQSASARLYEDTRDDCSSRPVTTPIHESTAGTTGSRYHTVYPRVYYPFVSLHG